MKAQEITIKAIVKRDEIVSNAPYRAISDAITNLPGMLVHQCFEQRDVEVDDVSGYECGYEDWFRNGDLREFLEVEESKKLSSILAGILNVLADLARDRHYVASKRSHFNTPSYLAHIQKMAGAAKRLKLEDRHPANKL